MHSTESLEADNTQSSYEMWKKMKNCEYRNDIQIGSFKQEYIDFDKSYLKMKNEKEEKIEMEEYEISNGTETLDT